MAWTLKALDKVRVRTMTRAGITDRHAMWAVRKNPADLSCEQRTSLASITTTNNTLYRAYLLKEQLRKRFRSKDNTADSCWRAGCRVRRIPASPNSSPSRAASAATGT